ncbi:YbjQ family protein [Burkholderia guangdongensis]|uniref:YbjQ family protein n=1 Tax=Burkholderia guangdongensis TaxID=1792500 RepID=UPI0015CDC153|nr:YbjQ family protein [Burkholderia guangdongensis]
MTDTARSLDDLTPDRVTTAFDLPGHTIVRPLGVVQGLVVRSRSIVGSFGAALQTLFGGNISLYTSMCERARRQAYEQMVGEARRLGANGIVAMRYDSTEIGAGVTEVICYGTAVRVTRDA